MLVATPGFEPRSPDSRPNLGCVSVSDCISIEGAEWRSDERDPQTMRFRDDRRVWISHNMHVTGRDTGDSGSRETQSWPPGRQGPPASSCHHTPIPDMLAIPRAPSVPPKGRPAFNHRALCQKRTFKELQALT